MMGGKLLTVFNRLYNARQLVTRFPREDVSCLTVEITRALLSSISLSWI
jgi:hypothetical protein